MTSRDFPCMICDQCFSSKAALQGHHNGKHTRRQGSLFYSRARTDKSLAAEQLIRTTSLSFTDIASTVGLSIPRVSQINSRFGCRPYTKELQSIYGKKGADARWR